MCCSVCVAHAWLVRWVLCTLCEAARARWGEPWVICCFVLLFCQLVDGVHGRRAEAVLAGCWSGAEAVLKGC